MVYPLPLSSVLEFAAVCAGAATGVVFAVVIPLL